MTDYASPVTPDLVLERAAKDVRDRAGQHRRAAEREHKLAEECELVAMDLEQEARNYERWQPKPDEPAAAGGAS